MLTTTIPEDFPRSAPAGAVPGAQPKLLAHVEAGRFVAAKLTDSEVQHRYEVCEDLVQQLVRYSARKRAERPDWTPAQLREKVDAAVRQKAFEWGLSPAETKWILRRLVAEAAGAPRPDGATS